MSNYRFIMKTEDNVISDDNGRLVMEDRDVWAKTEYANGDEEYAEGFVDYHKGSESEQSRMEEAADYNG
nr:MAG TPA: hypothetical protein [Caudoviricetes sp.]